MLCRHWSDNRSGFCRSPSCYQVLGTLEHLLIDCPGLEPAQARLYQMWLIKSAQYFISTVLISSPVVKVQFVLEPLAFPEIVEMFQLYGKPLVDHVAYLTRTFA